MQKCVYTTLNNTQEKKTTFYGKKTQKVSRVVNKTDRFSTIS